MRYHFPLFLLSLLYYIIMMRHDMGREIPEQETARCQDWLGWTGLGWESRMAYARHIYLISHKTGH